jgi:hypothetical protein
MSFFKVSMYCFFYSASRWRDKTTLTTCRMPPLPWGSLAVD